MTLAHSTQDTQSVPPTLCPAGLQLEAGELETMNQGLKRHVAAWRAAHESAVSHLTGMLARMDNLLERAGREHR